MPSKVKIEAPIVRVKSRGLKRVTVELRPWVARWEMS